MANLTKKNSEHYDEDDITEWLTLPQIENKLHWVVVLLIIKLN